MGIPSLIITMTRFGERQLEPESVYVPGHEVHNVGLSEQVRQLSSHFLHLPVGLLSCFAK